MNECPAKRNQIQQLFAYEVMSDVPYSSSTNIIPEPSCALLGAPSRDVKVSLKAIHYEIYVWYWTDEASSNANILSLPFRRSTQISLVSVIRQYINTKYDQHPDMFKNDLEVIDNLRRDAVNVREPHSMGIKKLQAYAAQLVWIGGKFPIDVRFLFSATSDGTIWKTCKRKY